MRSIYFDYNATTPLDGAVREAMRPYQERLFGNPSSIHHVGREARAALDQARDETATVFGCKPGEVVFTSGGTESNNLAIFGTARLLRGKGRHLITTSIEHHAVLHSFQYLGKKEGFDVTFLPVDPAGQVRPEDLKGALRPDTILVSVMAANNETGTLQPVSLLGEICRNAGVLFHTDAVQWFGKEPFRDVHQFNADLVSVCAHKLHGPKGAGALYIRSPLLPDPILLGGGHENERRAGTENVAGIVGFAETMKRFVKTPVFTAAQLSPLIQRLQNLCDGLEGVRVRGHREQRLVNTLAFTVQGCDSIALLAGMDLEGVCASSGSACSAGSLEPSHVLQAMGVSRDLCQSFVRFSLGRDTNGEEIAEVESILPGVIDRIRVSAGSREVKLGAEECE